MNDLFAAMWFNYLSFYFKEIKKISNENAGMYAGLILLCG